MLGIWEPKVFVVFVVTVPSQVPQLRALKSVLQYLPSPAAERQKVALVPVAPQIASRGIVPVCAMLSRSRAPRFLGACLSCALSSTSALQVGSVSVVDRVNTIRSPPMDTRAFRLVTLSNGLRALLVHDPEADRAAAAMVVRAGHFSDPEDTPGLAHFTEHMMVGNEVDLRTFCTCACLDASHRPTLARVTARSSWALLSSLMRARSRTFCRSMVGHRMRSLAWSQLAFTFRSSRRICRVLSSDSRPSSPAHCW